MTADLRLYEELVLLGLHDKKGILHSRWAPHAIAVAVLLELEFLERVAIDHGPEKFIDAIDPTPVDGLAMQAVLGRIIETEPRKRLSEWLFALGGADDLLELAAEDLVANGVLDMDCSRAFLVLKRTTYPQINPLPEQEVLGRLERAIFGNEPVDDRTALLVGLSHAAGLLRLEFGFDAVEQRRERIESLVKSSDVSLHTVWALEALGVGVMKIARWN